MSKLDIDKSKNVPSNLSILKRKVNKLDIEKKKTTPADLRKISNVVKIDVVEKIEYDEFFKKGLCYSDCRYYKFSLKN